MTRSRRQFLKLVAAGSAAALTGASRRSLAADAVKVAAKHTAQSAPASAGSTGSVRAEIQKQKQQTAETLKIIRDYPLPTGSPMAFAFKPLKAGRGRKEK